MTLINAFQIEKSYSGRILFKSVSFGVEEKQKVGLVGPNGAGKSTLLKILSGQINPDQGQITKKKGLTIGFLEQSPSFDEGATIMATILSKAQHPDEEISRAYYLMGLLELNRFGEDFLVAKLSGGWRKKVALARELMLEPEILFLDEPTNHLDVSSIIWLEDFLNQADFAVLMITHDRLFLQRVVNRVLDLDYKNAHFLLSVEGGYLDYLYAKENEMAAQQRQEQKLKNTLRRETEWLHRGAIARQTKQKARIKGAAVLKNQVEDVSARNSSLKVDISFADKEKTPQKLIEVENISKAYNGQLLFEKLNLLVSPKSRVALLGGNGSGKTTLIKILLGQETPDTGTVFRNEDVKYAYFEQNREILDPNLSVLKNICEDGDYVKFQGQFVHVRSYLDKFLFFGQKIELPVSQLSGGEQARLQIAKMMLIDAQVLILDEPTNDLDVDTLNVLEEALRSFSGAVILVTHDRYFMDAVSDKILGFPLENSPKKELLTFASYLQWEDWYEQEISGANAKGTNTSQHRQQLQQQQQQHQQHLNQEQQHQHPNQQRQEYQHQREQQQEIVQKKPKAKPTFKEKIEFEQMEAEILKMEDQLNQLQKDAELEVIQSNSKKLTEVHMEIGKLQHQLDKKYERWSELEEKIK
jgi:ATP-binding cassette subfamily F protein uup